VIEELANGKLIEFHAQPFLKGSYCQSVSIP
jgi:hypothetical protein